MPSYVHRLLLICLTALLGMTACQPGTEDPQNTVSAKAVSEIDKTWNDIPLGQLSTEVQPVAYQLELTIIPEREEFSGKTTINLNITCLSMSVTSKQARM